MRRTTPTPTAAAAALVLQFLDHPSNFPPAPLPPLPRASAMSAAASSSNAAASQQSRLSAARRYATDKKFTDLGLPETGVWKSLALMGLRSPFKVQAEVIPLLLRGENAIVKSKTGSGACGARDTAHSPRTQSGANGPEATNCAVGCSFSASSFLCSLRSFSGKTLAYAIPVVQQILDAQAKNDTRVPLTHLVLLPSSELCAQVRSTFQLLLRCFSGSIRCVALRADQPQANYTEVRETKPEIVVATPSMALEYARTAKKHNTNSYLSNVRHLVIDEADLVLGLGYEADLTALLQTLGAGYQMSLFSATIDPAVKNIRNLYMGESVREVAVEDESASGTGGAAGAKLTQFYMHSNARDKYLYAYAFLQLGVISRERRVLFFVNSVETGVRLKLFLAHFSMDAAVLNHELPANSRAHILNQFNRGVIDILIATDEAAGEARDAEQQETTEEEAASVTGKKRAKEEGDAVKDEDEEEEEQTSKKAKTDSSSKSTAKGNKKSAAAAAASSAVKAEDDDTAMVVKLESEEAQLDRDVAALAALDASNGPQADAAPRTSRRYRGHNHWNKTGGPPTLGGAANVSRGVDFKDVGTVVNFDFPLTVHNYIHRIGRTARADRTGVALSFVDPSVQKDGTNDEWMLASVLHAQTVRAAARDHVSESDALPDLQLLPFDTHAVEAFRYRVSDKLRSVTKIAVREERLSAIKLELVNSERLRSHWEDNPRELQLIKHDKVLRNAKVSKHLAVVPDYLLPEGMSVEPATSLADPSGGSDANRNKLRRNKHKNAVGAANALKKIPLDKMKGFALAKAKGRHTMATKNAVDPLRSFRAKPFSSAAAAGIAAASSSSAAAAASKPKVDF